MQKSRIEKVIDGQRYINCTICGKMLPASEEFFKINPSGKSLACNCKNCERKENKRRKLWNDARKRGISPYQLAEERAIRNERIEQKKREKANMPKGEIKTAGGDNRASICFDCKNSLGYCSWSECDKTKPGKPIKFEPVPGWDADVVYRRGSDGSITKTYYVKSCPQFERG